MTQVEVLSAARDRAGGYNVDVTRGERVGRVSSEWFSRPADERYLSLSDLYAAVRGRTERSRTRTVESAAIRVEASRDNAERVTLMLPGSDAPIAPTHWSFGQLAGLVGAPAAYLRQLPAALAGVDINTVRAWLGHVSIGTTNIYAEIDLTLKASAVALCEVGQPPRGRSWKEDKDLMA